MIYKKNDISKLVSKAAAGAVLEGWIITNAHDTAIKLADPAHYNGWFNRDYMREIFFETSFEDFSDGVRLYTGTVKDISKNGKRDVIKLFEVGASNVFTDDFELAKNARAIHRKRIAENFCSKDDTMLRHTYTGRALTVAKAYLLPHIHRVRGYKTIKPSDIKGIYRTRTTFVINFGSEKPTLSIYN